MPEKFIKSRGVPSKETMYLPAYNSPELRKFQDANEVRTRNNWHLEEVINFIFPEQYQETYHKTSHLFMQLMINKTKITGKDTSKFLDENNISKATFYNRVLPRLKRVGFIKVERETITPQESKRKYRPMIITLSKTFGNYLNKIGDSWLAIVDDAREKIKPEK